MQVSLQRSTVMLELLGRPCLFSFVAVVAPRSSRSLQEMLEENGRVVEDLEIRMSKVDEHHERHSEM